MLADDDRTPPKRVRLTGLQEAQLASVVELDQRCSAMFYDVGFDAAEVPVRTPAELAALTRTHSVHVAEADHVPAGMLAWRDESPGVAYLAEVSVHPDYQRFGVATKLLDAMKDEARGLGLQQIVVRCWEKATWALGFYRHHGFAPIDGAAPVKVQHWRDERTEGGRALTRPGEIALWAAVGAAPKVEDDEDDNTDVDAEPPDVG